MESARKSNTVDPAQRLKICRVVTVPITLSTLLHDQVLAVAKTHDVTLACNFTNSDVDVYFQREAGVQTFHVPLSRTLTPLTDLSAVLTLARFFHREKFDIVHSSTPKAGLVAMLAGAIARVPVRVHTFTGQPWLTLRGATRFMLRAADSLISRTATSLYADSNSQRKLLVEEGLSASEKIFTLGPGSISGVNLKRFDPGNWRDHEKSSLRKSLGIPSDSVVVTYVGRVVREKGIVELVDAFEAMQTRPVVTLLIIGPEEILRDRLPDRTVDAIKSSPHIVRTGFVTDPERFLSISDIFCIPSYREGFGSVVIEAGAMGLPTVATEVTGLVDAVARNETGLLVEKGSVPQLQNALEKLIGDDELRLRMGQTAREHAIRLYSSKDINRLVIQAYSEITKR